MSENSRVRLKEEWRGRGQSGTQWQKREEETAEEGGGRAETHQLQRWWRAEWGEESEARPPCCVRVCLLVQVSDLPVIQLYVCHAATAPVICFLRCCKLALTLLIFCFTLREISPLKRCFTPQWKGAPSLLSPSSSTNPKLFSDINSFFFPASPVIAAALHYCCCHGDIAADSYDV